MKMRTVLITEIRWYAYAPHVLFSVMLSMDFYIYSHKVLIPVNQSISRKRWMTLYLVWTPSFYFHQHHHSLTPFLNDNNLKRPRLVAADRWKSWIRLFQWFVDSSRSDFMFDGNVAVAAFIVMTYDWGMQDVPCQVSWWLLISLSSLHSLALTFEQEVG